MSVQRYAVLVCVAVLSDSLSFLLILQTVDNDTTHTGSGLLQGTRWVRCSDDTGLVLTLYACMPLRTHLRFSLQARN